MKIGLQIVRFDWPGAPANTGSKLAEIARTADEVGFESIWLMDHFFQMDSPPMGLRPEEPMLDGYTGLRSGGRANLGIGIQHFIFSMPNSHEIAPIEKIGREVIPAVAEF